MKQLFLAALAAASLANADAIDDIQPGTWYEVPNSRLDAVAPNPIPPGVEGVRAVLDDWTGAAYDSVNGRYLAWGGGHEGYAGNELYAFDMDTLTWARVTDPSSNVSCDFAVNEYPDGAPCSMHTYAYVGAHDGRFVILGGASPYPMGGGGAPVVHTFDGSWHRGAARSGGGSLQGATSAYDAERELFWVLPSYDQRFASYDPNADAWTQYGQVSIDIDGAAAIDPIHDLYVVVNGRHGLMSAIDLNAPNAAPVTLSVDGVTEPLSHPATGFEWDSATEQFVAWFGGASVWTLTPPAGDWHGTWRWDEVTPSLSNEVTPSANPAGTYSKWRYVPERDVFIVANDVTENVVMYRLPGGEAPTDAEADWVARSTAPGVVYANDFRTQAQFDEGVFPDSRVGNVTWDTQHSITGGHSIRFDILNTDSENSGNWRVWLRPSQQAFAEGEEFYVQYRLYIPAYHLGHRYLGGGGWKTSILSEYYASFNNHEVVLGNAGYYGYPRGYYRGRAQPGFGVDFIGWDLQMPYLGCAADPDFRHQPEIDHGPQNVGTECENNRARYGGLYGYGSPQYGESALPDPLTGAQVWRADQWQTVMQHVKVGHFDQPDSTIEVWYAADGEPFTLLFRREGVILGALDPGENGYEAVWFTPFDTGKDPDPTRQNTFMNYDQLIVSTLPIAAPGHTDVPPAPTVELTAAPRVVASGGSTTLTWTSSGAPQCVAVGGWSGVKSVSGSEVVSGLTASTLFGLRCGSARDRVAVIVH